MPVNSTHPEYDYRLEEWNLNAVMAAGSQAVKRNFETYVVDPFREGETEKKAKYKKLAVFTEFTFRTIETLKGMAFSKSPTIQLPTQIDYIRTNADANSNDLSQAMKMAVHSVLESGRYGLLVDYPQVEENLTKAQINAQGLRASIFGYKAREIINWRTDKDKLTLVVLTEFYDKSIDGFEVEKEVQYRALRLIDGVYTVELYRDSMIYATYQPRDAGGRTFDHIPFYFIGALNNDSSCDRPPLSAIADLNRAYFQNSCDLELHVHIAAGGLLHISLGENETADTFAENNLDGIKVGTYAVAQTMSGGSVNFVQPPENNLILKVREEKRDEMLLLGAKLIKPDMGNMTATQASIVHQGETSTLSDIVDNVAISYTKAIKDVAMFMYGEPSDDDVLIDFDKSFYAEQTDAQVLQLIYQAVLGGYYTKQDWHKLLLKAGLTDEEDYQVWSDFLGNDAEVVI